MPDTFTPKQRCATLRLTNDAGLKSTTALGRNYERLSEHHRNYLRVNRIESEKGTDIYGQDDSGNELDPLDLPPDELWDAEWNIFFGEPSSEGSGLDLSIGKGSSDKGNNRGVDLLVVCPGQHAKGVLPVHAILRIHPRSGFLQIGGTDDNHKVRYILDNESVLLGKDEWHTLFQPINCFYLARLECKLTYEALDRGQLEVQRKKRNELFEIGGFRLPDSRLPVLPLQKPKLQIGTTLLYEYMACGSYGTVGVGVDAKTGEPCAIKTIDSKRRDKRGEIMTELELCLKFTGWDGIVQASHVCCDHGKSVGHGHHLDVKATFTSCPVPDHLYIIMDLAECDFSQITHGRFTFEQVTNIMYGPAKGLYMLHADGVIHRDVRTPNMLLFWVGGKPVGVLADPGLAVRADFAISERIGTQSTRAPEIDGVHRYTSKADVYSLGVAFGRLIVAVFCVDRQPGELDLRHDWSRDAILHHLDWIGIFSDLRRHICDLIIDMLEIRPGDRPSMKEVVDRWYMKPSPGTNDTNTRGDDSKRPRKIAKTSTPLRKAGSMFPPPTPDLVSLLRPSIPRPYQVQPPGYRPYVSPKTGTIFPPLSPVAASPVRPSPNRPGTPRPRQVGLPAQQPRNHQSSSDALRRLIETGPDNRNADIVPRHVGGTWTPIKASAQTKRQDNAPAPASPVPLANKGQSVNERKISRTGIKRGHKEIESCANSQEKSNDSEEATTEILISKSRAGDKLA